MANKFSMFRKSKNSEKIDFDPLYSELYPDKFLKKGEGEANVIGCLDETWVEWRPSSLSLEFDKAEWNINEKEGEWSKGRAKILGNFVAEAEYNPPIYIVTRDWLIKKTLQCSYIVTYKNQIQENGRVTRVEEETLDLWKGIFTDFILSGSYLVDERRIPYEARRKLEIAKEVLKFKNSIIPVVSNDQLKSYRIAAPKKVSVEGDLKILKTGFLKRNLSGEGSMTFYNERGSPYFVSAIPLPAKIHTLKGELLVENPKLVQIYGEHDEKIYFEKPYLDSTPIIGPMDIEISQKNSLDIYRYRDKWKWEGEWTWDDLLGLNAIAFGWPTVAIAVVGSFGFIFGIPISFIPISKIYWDGLLSLIEFLMGCTHPFTPQGLVNYAFFNSIPITSKILEIPTYLRGNLYVPDDLKEYGKMNLYIESRKKF